MMGIPNEHQLKFNSIKDAKKLMKAIEKRFGGNAATKKTQRNLLKQQYENFTAPSSEMLDQTFDRLQKLVSQNKADLDTMSMDDLYNNLKVYELEVKGMSSSSSSTHNMAFVSFSNNNTSNTNDAVNTAQAVNTAHGVSIASTQINDAYSINIGNLSDAVICAFFASQPNSPQLVQEDLQQIHLDDMEEMDLRWQMAMLTMRWSATTATRGDIRECRVPKNQDNKNKESSSSDSEVFNDSIFPPPYTGNFMPPTPDLSFIRLDEFVNEPIVEKCKAMSSEEEPKVVRKNDDAPSIEEWVSDDEEEDVSQPKIEKKTVRPSIVKKEFVKSKQQEKTARKTIKQVEQHRQNTHSPRGNQRNWNNMMSQKLGSNFEMFNKACYVCGSFDHLQDDCNYHQKQFQNQRMGNPQMDLQDQGVIDSGCSRHMTGNMSYLTCTRQI
ncbi:hypothetical protein Tco_1214697 [Tanacetum coccineum]